MPAILWDDEFTIQNAGFSPGITNQSMTVLNDGRIVAVWNASNVAGDGDPTEFGTGVRARILNPDGSPAGAEFTVNSTTLNSQNGATVTTLSDGRFVVTWHSNENGDGGSGANLTIRARVFNADGTPALYDGDGAGPNAASTDDFVVNDQARFQDHSPQVVAVSGGGFVISWQMPTAPFGFHDIAMRVFGNNGPAGLQQSINTPSSHDGEPKMTALAGGKYVVGWRQGLGFEDDMVARIFNADGTPAAQGGVKFTLSSAGFSTLGDQYQLDLATLSDGRFVAVWGTNTGSDGGGGDGNGEGVRARVFNADGTADMAVNGGNDFIVNTTTANVQNRPQVVGLADGRFLISFASQNPPSGSNTAVLARLFNSDGTPDGNDFVIENPAGASFLPAHALVTTLDGRALSLYDRLGTGPDALYGHFIDFATAGVNTTGDGGDNALLGTAFDDVLSGLGGADRLSSGGGNDIVTGGAGDDVLNGGGGNDNVNGDAGDDTLTGGSGIDLLNGGANADTLDGGDGNDVLRGGTGADTVTGGGGNDRILHSVGDGADTVVGFVAGAGSVDKLVLTGHAVNTVAEALATATQNGADTVFNFGNGDTLTLTNVTKANLHADDFVLDFFGASAFALNSFGSSPAGGGWANSNQYPRTAGDVNGDGRADIVGFGDTGTYVALGNANGTFQNPIFGINSFGFSDAGGNWANNNQYPRTLGDVNGDGRADIVGFGDAATYVALGNANGTFQNPIVGVNSFGFSAAGGGWATNDKYPRTTGDVNGDGRADLIGFGDAGTYVALANANGTFQSPALIINSFGFSAAGGSWSSNDKYPRTAADVNGDGRADLVGFGDAGVYVALATANGPFLAPILAINSFGFSPAGGGWANNNQYPRTLGDVNEDGRADLIGFGGSGIYVSLANGDGTFAAPVFDLADFGTATGWSSSATSPRTLADVNGDGADDVVGFGNDGVFVSLSQDFVV